MATAIKRLPHFVTLVNNVPYPGILVSSAVTTAAVMIILANAACFAWIISAERGPQQLVELVGMITRNKYLILLLINVFSFLLGCLIDTTSAMVMTFPALYPLAESMGISGMHLGIIMCTNLIIGMTIPPLGLTLFTACSIGGISISKTVKPLLPMLAMMFLVTLIITYFPDVALFLPEMLLQ